MTNPANMNGKVRLTALMLFLCAACTGIPDGVEPVSDFEVDRYLGPGMRSRDWIIVSSAALPT